MVNRQKLVAEVVEFAREGLSAVVSRFNIGRLSLR